MMQIINNALRLAGKGLNFTVVTLLSPVETWSKYFQSKSASENKICKATKFALNNVLKSSELFGSERNIFQRQDRKSGRIRHRPSTDIADFFYNNYLRGVAYVSRDDSKH